MKYPIFFILFCVAFYYILRSCSNSCMYNFFIYLSHSSQICRHNFELYSSLAKHVPQKFKLYLGFFLKTGLRPFSRQCWAPTTKRNNIQKYIFLEMNCLKIICIMHVVAKYDVQEMENYCIERSDRFILNLRKPFGYLGSACMQSVKLLHLAFCQILHIIIMIPEPIPTTTTCR